jgi:signal transduction histidine kinase
VTAAPPTPPGRYAPVAVLAVTLFVFAVIVAYLALWLRTGLRQQILEREAEALKEVASFQLTTEAEAFRALGVSDAPGALLNAVLKTSKLRGVFAVRVFDHAHQFSGAVPVDWSEDPPGDEVWQQLETGRPIARLHPRESAAQVIGLSTVAPSSERTEPLLETWLPLRESEQGQLSGAAQMWTNGEAIAREFAALDRRLLTQAIFAWIGGAVIIGTLLIWAFRRLAQANDTLQLRTEDLLRANRELTLAAKTSALGAVTAHLMHELKNPLAGLEEFVANQVEATEGGSEVAAASELTRRLRTMINDVAGVLHDEQAGGGHYTLTVDEIAELAVTKVRPIAASRSVRLESQGKSSASLPARRANLVRLVLHNLLQNALEATPASKRVRLTVIAADGGIRFRVEDQGTGLPAQVRERLFQPCASTKPGGSGLGLALSQQLARQAGARLGLVSSDSTGTQFELVLEPEL